MSNEADFLGSLLPSHPDLVPIIQTMRDKYTLPEIKPEDDPITEVYIGDEIIPLEEFHKDIENRIRDNLVFLSPDAIKAYRAAQALTNLQDAKDIETYPEDFQKNVQAFTLLAKQVASPLFEVIDAQLKAIADMIYIYLLTGETEEVPTDWISKVISYKSFGEPVIAIIANQLADPEEIIRQFRNEYSKKFGAYHPKITKTHTSTAYFYRLKKLGKPFNYILEEYIRLNKLPLPRDRTSKKYFDARRRYSERLKKRIQRSETILEVLIRDKK